MGVNIIIARTPLRISLFGGGTDIPAYSSKFEGRVVSFTINKYVNVILNKKFDSGFRLSYSETEKPATINKIKHSIIREVLSMFDTGDGLEIVSIADIPSSGSGLGSSSSFTIGLIHCVSSYLNLNFDRQQIAKYAYEVEHKVSKGAVGKQDQYAASFGGINSIVFSKDSLVDINPINIGTSEIDLLENSMLLFYTGKTRNASKLLSEQIKLTSSSEATQLNLHAMKDMCALGIDYLIKGSLKEVGLLLGKSWELKKLLHRGISSNEIDENYILAINAGAWGGKLLGAGGGGFFLVIAPVDIHSKIISAVKNWRRVEFSIDFQGTQIQEIQ